MSRFDLCVVSFFSVATTHSYQGFAKDAAFGMGNDMEIDDWWSSILIIVSCRAMEAGDASQRLGSSGDRVPILFYSGVSGKADQKAAMTTGTLCYLLNSNGVADLVETIDRLIDQKSTHEMSPENIGQTPSPIPFLRTF